MTRPILILPLSKAGWSDEARAAALAARAAKKEGQDPKVAAAVAKRLVERGVSRQDAVKRTAEVMKARSHGDREGRAVARVEGARKARANDDARKARVAAAYKKLHAIDDAKVSKFYGELKGKLKQSGF